MIQGVNLFPPEHLKQQGGGKAGVSPSSEDQMVDATVVKVISPTRHNPSLLPGSVIAALGSLAGESPFSALAKLVLPLLSSGSSDSMAEKSILTAKGPLTPARLNKLRDLLFSLSLKSELPDNGFLPRLLERSGMLWEKNLASIVRSESTRSGKADFNRTDFDRARQEDLKGYILSLLSRVDPEDKEQLLPLREFVDAIEKFQVLNSHSSDSSRYLIPFPIFSNDSFSFGQLFFDLGGEKNEARPDAPRLVRVSLFLTMTNLGALRVDLSVLNKDISAMFQVEDDSVVSFIKTMMPTLRKRLRSHGFQLLQVECRRGTPERLSKTCLVDRMVRKGNLDLDLDLVV